MHQEHLFHPFYPKNSQLFTVQKFLESDGTIIVLHDTFLVACGTVSFIQNQIFPIFAFGQWVIAKVFFVIFLLLIMFIYCR